ncbi:Membrane-spanning protein [Gulosibacter sp. 10]|nr:Membrane-spanning protein [Gulosibacter sp. 10]
MLAIGILTATIALSIALIAALGAFALHTRVSVAADAAALAAADTASHRVPGEPCARAHAAAALHGVELVACESGYRESVVTVSAGFGPLELSSSARAGLPR